MIIKHTAISTGFAATMLLGGCMGEGGSDGSGSATPFASVLDVRSAKPQQDIFVSDVAANVLFYTANIHQQNPPLLGEITQGISRSSAVWIDRHGTLYVVNSGGSTTNVEE
jgi:hypothetical protein